MSQNIGLDDVKLDGLFNNADGLLKYIDIFKSGIMWTMLPFRRVDAEEFSVEEQSTPGGIGARRYNDDYSEQDISKAVWKKYYPSLIGGVIRLDHAFSNGEKVYSKKMETKIKTLTRFYDWLCFYGDRSASLEGTQFDGLYQYIDSSSPMYVEWGTGNGEVLSSTTVTDFLLHLDQTIDLVEQPDVIFCSKKSKSMLIQALREASSLSIENLNNRFVEMYRGLPIIALDKDHLGNLMLNNNETVGTSSDCTSLWIAHLSEEDGLTGLAFSDIDKQLITYTGMIDVWKCYLLEAKVGIALLDKYCVSRMAGIRYGTSW